MGQRQSSSKSTRFSGLSCDFIRIPVDSQTGKIIQPKLKVNVPGDHYEQEADRVASQVLQQERPESREKKMDDSQISLRRAPNPPSTLPTQDLSRALRGDGQPLPQSEQEFFEPRFAADFSQVRVHADTQAAATARAVNARAFTLGRHIVFGNGAYQPTTSEGKKLLAHELAHVIQQSGEPNQLASSRSLIQRDDVERMSITPQYALGLSDEQLSEQIRILRELTQAPETSPSPEFQGEVDVAHSNLLILQGEQRCRRSEKRRSRIQGTNWGGFRQASEVTASGLTVNDRILYIMEVLQERYGYSLISASALVGNISAETGEKFIPNLVETGQKLVQTGGSVPRGGGVGLVQWTNSRRTSFLGTEQGTDILFNMDAQLEFIIHELRSTHQGVNKVLTNPGSLEQATSKVFLTYEAPKIVLDWTNAVKENDQQQIQITRGIMDRERRRRIKAAIRARDLYLREHAQP
jgi:hypothetical protein